MCERRGLQPRSLSHVGRRTRILSIREAALKGAGCDVIRAEKRSGATTAGRAESLLAFVPRSFHEFVRVTPTLHIKNCPHRMGKVGIKVIVHPTATFLGLSSIAKAKPASGRQ